jgi:hypothetical protein
MFTRTLVALLLLLTVASAAPGGPLHSSVADAKQETEPQMVAALATINQYRAWLGVQPLTVDPALQQAAEAHVNYYSLNYGDPDLAGMGLHYETAGKPGFTGESFQDRADAAGYTGWVNENAGLSGSMTWSLDWFIGTVGHRLTLLDPRYIHIGLAAINDGDKQFEIIDLGSAEHWSYTWDDPQWTAWPPDGATGVGLSFDGEAPNPFPDANYPVGYPTTLKYFGDGDLTLGSATLSDASGVVPSFSIIGDGWLTSQTVELCASAPLTPGERYRVHITGTANGAPFTRDWSFTASTGDDDPLALDGNPGVAPPPPAPSPTPTPPAPTPTPTPTPDPNLPPGLAAADPAVQQLWQQADGPVASGAAARSWLWGPDIWLGKDETYADASSGERQVYYLDKARMELNDDGASDYVTAGLLVRDMIAGVVQVGNDDYQQVQPAWVQLAGDPLKDNPDAPTYASLTNLASIVAGREATPRVGQPITDVLAQDGSVRQQSNLGKYSAYGSFEPTLGHNLAAVFEPYLQALPSDWHTSVGLPLSEPYWTRTRVNGVETWVLIQAFERRVLTYTPANAPDWRIEMGNIGRHYYTWRYGTEPPADPDAWIP